MNTPSIKTLREVFGANAKRAKFLLHAGTLTLTHAFECQARIRECYTPPPQWDLCMHALNTLANAHGVEGLEALRRAGTAWYLNTGDTYTPTLIFWQGRYRVQSIGDFIETMERRGIRFN